MGINSYFKRIRALAAEKSGAALVEFAVAMFPLFSLFFVQLQVAAMFVAHLTLHHAAVQAARCAVIQSGPNLPGLTDTGGAIINNDGTSQDSNAEATCRKAAVDALGQGLWYNTLWDLKATTAYTAGCNDHNASAGGAAQYGDATTTVTANFMCNVPIGAIPICGGMGSKKPLKVIVKLPHEGACYTIDSNKDG